MLLLGAMSGMGLSVAPAAHAQSEDACTPMQESAKNRDGAVLMISSTCESQAPRYTVRYLAPHASKAVTVGALEQDDDLGEPFRSVGFIDLDGDGIHEIEARGGCGAGPNCLGEVYRVDPRKNALELFFSGGYADLRMLDGHLVESGRASCCSWEYHAWRVAGHAVPLVYDHMDLMITVGADLGSEDDDAPGRCTFQRRSGDNWQVITPPGPAWLSLCETYGDAYHLVTPEEAQAADAAAQEQ